MFRKHFTLLLGLLLVLSSPLAFAQNRQNTDEREDAFADDPELGIGAADPPIPNTEDADSPLGLFDETTIDDDNARLPLNFCPSKEEVMAAIPPISQVSASIRLLHGPGVPEDCSSFVFEGVRPASPRTDQISSFHWEPTNFFHYPLYFDDTPLERYGQSICPAAQPFLSGARFFATLPIMPYKLGIDRPLDCVSTLGYYRPGTCAPCIRERFPAWEKDAVLLQVGTVMALVFALP